MRLHTEISSMFLRTEVFLNVSELGMSGSVPVFPSEITKFSTHFQNISSVDLNLDLFSGVSWFENASYVLVWRTSLTIQLHR